MVVELVRQNVVDEANHFWLSRWPHPEILSAPFRLLTAAKEK
jgi:hypothetical protein